MSRTPLKYQIAADLADARTYISQLEADNARLRAQLAELSTPRAEPSAPRGVRSSKLEALRAFAMKFKCSARYNGDTIELYSRKRQCWVAVPEGVQP